MGKNVQKGRVLSEWDCLLVRQTGQCFIDRL